MSNQEYRKPIELQEWDDNLSKEENDKLFTQYLTENMSMCWGERRVIKAYGMQELIIQFSGKILLDRHLLERAIFEAYDRLALIKIEDK